MTMKLLIRNDLDSATLSASPALVTTLPEANLQRARRDAVARSTSAADQTLDATWAAAVAVDAFCVWGHNLTADGTVRARLYTSDNWTGSPVYDSGAVAALPAKPLGELSWGIDPLGTAWAMAGSTPHTVRWLDAVYVIRSARFDLSDSGNPDGYLEAQRLYIGAVGKAGDLLVSLYPDDASLGRRLQYTLAARLDSLPEFVSSHLNANTVTLTLQEI